VPFPSYDGESVALNEPSILQRETCAERIEAGTDQRAKIPRRRCKSLLPYSAQCSAAFAITFRRSGVRGHHAFGIYRSPSLGDWTASRLRVPHSASLGPVMCNCMGLILRFCFPPPPAIPTPRHVADNA